jgi:RNA polymerase sigma factor (sigma-70 family)
MPPETNDLENQFAARSERLEQDIAAYIAGDDEAGNRICLSLEPVVLAEVTRLLSKADFERDDVVQDTLLAFLTYLRRAGRGPRRPEAFVVTMAGNRCRNLYRRRKRRPTLDVDLASDWLPGKGKNPHEILESRELEEMVRRGFAKLDPACRQLLLSIYVDQRPMEELQREAGLGTVQGIYYRKYACLKKLHSFLNKSWFGGRETGSEE